MAAHTVLSRRAESNNNNIILIVAIIIGVVVLLASIVLVVTVIRRRRRKAHQTLYQGSIPPMASYSPKSSSSTSSSLLRDVSSDWYQPSPYPLSPNRRLEPDMSTRSSLLPEASNGWYRPSHYVQVSHKHTTSDTNAGPSVHETSNKWGHSAHYLSHSRVASDSSTKPLLRETKNDLDYVERPVPIHRTTEEDILSNNPTGQYRVPVSRPTSRGSDHTPASSSFCLAGMDVTPSSDNPYLAPRPLLPPLPPLIIPQKSKPQKSTDWFMPPHIPHTVVEEPTSSPSSASCASSASSAYSHSTAHHSPSQPTYLRVSQNGVTSPEPEPQQHRRNTAFVGTLLKARAERNPGGLVREASQVSHIERNGSIRSVGGSDQRYPRWYRAKKSGRIGDMVTLRGVSDRGSLQIPS